MTKSAEDQPIGSSQETEGDKENRRKILIGEAVLAKVQHGDWSQGQLNELLHSEMKTDQADRAGAFQEDAMSEGDVTGSSDEPAAIGAIFVPDSSADDEIPVFLNAPRSDDLPTHFTTLLNPDAIADLVKHAPIPNETTAKALQESRVGVGVHQAKDIDDLFAQVGICGSD